MIGGVTLGADGTARIWIADTSRRVWWFESGDKGGALALPVPGAARVVALDPFGDPFVLIATGDSFVYRARPGMQPAWRGQGDILKGGRSMFNRSINDSSEEPRLTGAWIRRLPGAQRQIVAATVERLVLVLAPDTPALQIGPGPVPGDAAILAAHVEGREATVVLDDGTVWTSIGGRWSRSATIGAAAAAGAVALRALKGFRLDRDRVVAVGDTFEVGAERARELLAQGFAAGTEPAGEAG